MKLSNSYLSMLNIPENDPIMKPADIVGVAFKPTAYAAQPTEKAINGETAIMTGETIEKNPRAINVYLNDTMINQLLDNNVIPARHCFTELSEVDELTVVSFTSTKWGNVGYRFD